MHKRTAGPRCPRGDFGAESLAPSWDAFAWAVVCRAETELRGSQKVGVSVRVRQGDDEEPEIGSVPARIESKRRLRATGREHEAVGMQRDATNCPDPKFQRLGIENLAHAMRNEPSRELAPEDGA